MERVEWNRVKDSRGEERRRQESRWRGGIEERRGEEKVEKREEEERGGKEKIERRRKKWEEEGEYSLISRRSRGAERKEGKRRG